MFSILIYFQMYCIPLVQLIAAIAPDPSEIIIICWFGVFLSQMKTAEQLYIFKFCPFLHTFSIYKHCQVQFNWYTAYVQMHNIMYNT